MDKLFKKITIFPVVLGLILISFIFFENSYTQSKPQAQQENIKGVEKAQSDSFTYNGKLGKNALFLLKENATIVQDKSGLVSTINNRVADSKNREYWAFYVNGKQASVGPLEYQTKDNDVIEWKIEKF